MDNRTIEEIRENETRLINELKVVEQERDKYKNIVEEFKKWLKNYLFIFDYDEQTREYIKEALNKLQELKGGSDE